MTTRLDDGGDVIGMKDFRRKDDEDWVECRLFKCGGD